jgi:hypothetical protein
MVEKYGDDSSDNGKNSISFSMMLLIDVASSMGVNCHVFFSQVCRVPSVWVFPSPHIFLFLKLPSE